MLDEEIRIPPPGYRSAPQRRAEEMRRMLLIAGGAGVIVLLCVIGYFVAAGGGSGGVPVIQAPATPVKVKPANPGGLAVSTPTGALPGTGGGGVSLAPPPETPDPAALVAQAKQEQQQQQQQASALNPANVTPPPAAPAAPAAQAVLIPTVPETPAAPGGKQMAMTVPPPSKETARVHDLAQEYNPPADHKGAVKVQLAALDSRDAAERAWEHLTHRMPGLFAGRRPLFVEARVNGHTYWRVRVAGFSSTSEADRFCRDVRAHGGACAVAAF